MVIGASRPPGQILIAGAQLTLIDVSMPQSPRYRLPVEYGSLPAWSPDGEALAVIDPTSRRLSIFSADLRQRHDIATDFLIQLPVWSPDGAWIAVTGYPSMDAFGRPRSNDADV